MSPKQATIGQSFPQSQTYSPWTDAYQTNPMHLNGTYANPNGSKTTPREDESQTPTHEALSHIYDLDERG